MKRFLQILFTAGALALMIFTKAAVLVSATGPDHNQLIRSFYSYFAPVVAFGGANFPPLITAVLTCILLILGFAAIKSRKAGVALCILAPITFIVSLLSLLYGLRYYSLLAACISLCLLLSAIFAIAAAARRKPPKAPAGQPPMPPAGSPPPPPPQYPQQ